MFDRFSCGTAEHCGRDMRHRMNDDCFRPTESVDRDVFVRETRTSTSWHQRPDCTCDHDMRR